MNDLISRQAALDAIGEQPLVWTDDDEYAQGMATQWEYDTVAIKALPSAPPEGKKGKWIRITQGAMPEQYICPFCHRTVEAYGVEELLSIRYPYCHCGADMRGEEND